MANFDQDTQRKTGFFHSLGYVLTKDVNNPSNEMYKSAHNVQSNEIWIDEINYCKELSDAITEATNNPAVKQVGTLAIKALLYPLKNSNGQAWFLDTGTPVWDTNGYLPTDDWVRPFISPVDVADTDGAPSMGFQFTLYKNDGIVIPPLEGRWEVDYYGGFLKFNVGYTPYESNNELGYHFSRTALEGASDKTQFLEANGIRAIAFQYDGRLLNEFIDSTPDGLYKVNSQKGMDCNLTTNDYDVATNELVEFEPFGDKSIDILINGVEIDNVGYYTFTEPSAYDPLTSPTLGTNTVTVESGEEPSVGGYFRFSNGTTFEYRRVLSINGQVITYGGGDVDLSFDTVDKFTTTNRPNGEAKEGDLLLWVGSTFYELEDDDKITFEYITADPLAL